MAINRPLLTVASIIVVQIWFAFAGISQTPTEGSTPTSPSSTPSSSTHSPPSEEPSPPPRQKDLPRETWLEPPDYNTMGASHQQFRTSGDIHSKFKPFESQLFDEAPETFVTPKRIYVFTQGQPMTLTGGTDEKVPAPRTFHAFSSTDEEVSTLAAYGTVEWRDPLAPAIRVAVSSRQAIRDIIGLEFVYSVEMEKQSFTGTCHGCPGADPNSPYSLTWIQQNQKVTNAWASRDQDDGLGNGAMPNSVWFAMVDAGYDLTESVFLQPYAASQIVHCHDMSTGQEWTSPFGAGFSTPDPICGSAAQDNTHGTLTADIWDTMNKGGGALHVYNLAAGGDHRQIYSHIRQSHPGIDVIFGAVALVGPVGECMGPFDDILEDLVKVQQTYIGNIISNEATQHVTLYPGDSTWAFGVGGATNGNPWGTAPNAVSGDVALTANCPRQQAWHASTDGATSIFKPDVYGFLHVLGDNLVTYTGTSVAQPAIASGLGTIASRWYLAQNPEWIPWKTWASGCPQFGGADVLVTGSKAPDGREVTPTDRSLLGDLADHDAWYLNPTNC